MNAELLRRAMLPALVGLLLGLGAPAALADCRGEAPSAPDAMPALRDLLQHALQDDPVVRAARLDREAAGHGVEAARARYFPTLQVSAQDGHTGRQNRAPFERKSEDHSSTQYGLTLSQLLFDGRKTALGVTEARARQEQERVRAVRAVNERLLAVLDASHQLRVERLRVAAARSARDELRKIVQINAVRVNADQASLIDLRRAESRLLEAERTVEDSRVVCAQAVERFERLTRLRASQLPAELPAFTAVGAGELRRLSERCASDCPELRESVLQLERGQAELGMQRAAALPTVSVEASANALRNANGIAENYRQYSAGVKIAWTLQSGGETTARTNQVARNVEALGARVAETRRKVGEDFAAGELQFTGALASYELAQSSMRVARDARLLAERAYLAGVRGSLEFADTIVEENRNVGAGLSLDVRRYTALYTLYAMVGELPALFDLAPE